jgi:hypothetical protein
MASVAGNGCYYGKSHRDVLGVFAIGIVLCFVLGVGVASLATVAPSGKIAGAGGVGGYGAGGTTAGRGGATGAGGATSGVGGATAARAGGAILLR